MVDGARTGLVGTVGSELRVMVGVDCASAMEIVVVHESDLRVSKITNKVLEGTLFDPRGTLDARRCGDVDDIALVARLLHNRATFLIHGLKERSKVAGGFFA